MEFSDLMPYFLLIISIIFIGMALTVFLRKKPLIINSIFILFLMMLCFLPQMISSLKMVIENPSFMGILPVLMLSILIVMFLYIMRGYTIYGVNGDDFQKILIESLNENNYEYEEKLSSIKFKNPDIELSISIQPWIGAGQIRFKGKRDTEFLKKIMDDLRKKEIKPNYIFPIFYALIGLILSILSIMLILN